MSCDLGSSDSAGSATPDENSKTKPNSAEQTPKLICFHPRCNNFACSPCGKKFGKTRSFQPDVPRSKSFWRLDTLGKTFTNSFIHRRHPEAVFHQTIGLVDGRISSFEFQGPGRGDLFSPGNDSYTRVSFNEHICFESYYKIDEHTGLKVPSFRIEIIRTLDPWSRRDCYQNVPAHYEKRSKDWIPIGPDSFLSYHCLGGFPSKTLHSRIQLHNFVTSSIKSITNTLTETGPTLYDKRTESYSIHPFTKKESVCVRIISYDRQVHSLKVTFKPTSTSIEAAKIGNQFTLDLINATSTNEINKTSVSDEKTALSDKNGADMTISKSDIPSHTPADDDDEMPALAEPEEREEDGFVFLSLLNKMPTKNLDDPSPEKSGSRNEFQKTLKTMMNGVLNRPHLNQPNADEPVDLRIINKEPLHLKPPFVYLIRDLSNKPGALKIFKNDLLFFREDKTIVHHHIIDDSSGRIQAFNLYGDNEYLKGIKINEFTVFADRTVTEKDLRLIKAPFYKTKFEPDSQFVHPCLKEEDKNNRLLVVNHKPRHFYSKIDCEVKTRFLNKYFIATQDEAERLVVLLDEAANDQHLTNLLFFLTEGIHVVNSGKAVFEGPLAAA
jgi:hypothetical protein